MWEDPIVKEVRRIRMEIEQECDNDLRKIYEYALKIQEEEKRKGSVRYSSKPLSNAQGQVVVTVE